MVGFYEKCLFFSHTICVLCWGFYFFAEDTLWTGTPGNYTDPKAPEALAEVRKLVDNGEYFAATEAAVKLSGNPSDVRYSMPKKCL